MSENINYAKGFRPKTWAKIIPFVRPYFKNLAIVTGLMAFNSRSNAMVESGKQSGRVAIFKPTI